MTSEPNTSRLVAVLSADVANFDELAKGDAAKAASAFGLLREVVEALARDHHGALAGATDTVIRAEFVDVGDAVTAAVAIQDALDAKRAAAGVQVDARAGVAVGKVSGNPGDLSGPGIAMADGLREGAEPGGVNLSGAAYEQSRARMGDRFVRVGRQPVGGEELFVYRLDTGPTDDAAQQKWGPHGWSHHHHGRHRSRAERRQWRAEFRERWREPKTPEERAEVSVERLKRFYRNVLIGGVVVGFLFLVNLFSAHADWWFVWPAIAIAAILFLQAMRAVGPDGLHGSEKWKHWAAERKYWAQQMEAEMRSKLSEAGADDRAIRKRLQAMGSFHRRATTFGVIALFLLCINVITSPGHWWVVWPALGMAFALAMNAVHVYGPDAFLGSDWEARKRAEMKAKFERES